MSRKLTSYELRELRKHGYELSNASKLGDAPIEYITGTTQFYSRDFLVNSHVLIPRIESEQTITEVLKFCKPGKAYTIADIGTGSGCLGISLLLELNQQKTSSVIYLSDVSPEALNVTKQNASRLVPKNLCPHIRFQKSNLLSSYPKNLLFDIIVANLPYVPTSRIPKLPKSVRNYEPVVALDGGPSGTKYINRLIKQLLKHLKQDGVAIIEIDDTHNLDDFLILDSLHARITKDHLGRNRFLHLSYC